jgi:hypothetical protein
MDLELKKILREIKGFFEKATILVVLHVQALNVMDFWFLKLIVFDNF